MVDLQVRDVFILSAVLGTMVGTMTFFMHIFATGIDVDDLGTSLRAGVFTGIATTVVILSYTSVRYVERQRRLAEVEVTIDPIDRLQLLLQPLEHQAAQLPWASEKVWTTASHVRVDRGTLTVDMHELDLEMARQVLEKVIASREWIGRVRIVTGRGLHSKTLPKIRPMVIERLRQVVKQLDWEILLKKGSLTLRPMGKAPTPQRWVMRFIFLGGPITIAFAFAFRDLAGDGAHTQGLFVGIGLGILLSGMLATYRERQ